MGKQEKQAERRCRPGYWVNSAGDATLIRGMKDAHLLNALKFLERAAVAARDKFALQGCPFSADSAAADDYAEAMARAAGEGDEYEEDIDYLSPDRRVAYLEMCREAKRRKMEGYR